jgi:hypothetical protein
MLKNDSTINLFINQWSICKYNLIVLEWNAVFPLQQIAVSIKSYDVLLLQRPFIQIEKNRSTNQLTWEQICSATTRQEFYICDLIYHIAFSMNEYIQNPKSKDAERIQIPLLLGLSTFSNKAWLLDLVLWRYPCEGIISHNTTDKECLIASRLDR